MKKLLVVLTIYVSIIYPELLVANESYPVNDADKIYFFSIQDAVLNKNKQWLADQIQFPIQIAFHKHKKKIRTADEFVRYYDKIINVYVQNSVRQQDAGELFKNWQGVMIGRGTIWYQKSGDNANSIGTGHYYIIAVNNAPP